MVYQVIKFSTLYFQSIYNFKVKTRKEFILVYLVLVQLFYSYKVFKVTVIYKDFSQLIKFY